MNDTTTAAYVRPEIARARASYKIDPAKKCAIIGFASSSRQLAPYNDPSFEIWGLNSIYAMVPRISRLYEMHIRTHFEKDLQRAELKQIGVEHIDWLKKQPGPGAPNYCPIVMQAVHADIPASVAWPRNELNAWTLEMFGPEAEVDYFTSTPGQMIVSAIYEGYGEIHVYGVDLLQDEEYAYQRPGAEYWLGIARGLGIKVFVHPASALLKANYVYGYTEPAVEFGKLTPMVDFFKEKQRQLETSQQQILALLNTVNGARQVVGAVKAKLAAGETIEQIGTYVGLEDTNLQGKFDQGMGDLNKVVGQIEAFQYSASMAGHFGRGGRLDGAPAQDTAAKTPAAVPA